MDTDGTNMDDTSAASIHSTTSQRSIRKEGSRLVRIDYNTSNDNGPPYASITGDSIDNHGKFVLLYIHVSAPCAI